jgi:hypothetical protein
LAEGKRNLSSLSVVSTVETILTQTGVREDTPRVIKMLPSTNKDDSGLLLPLSEGELGAIIETVQLAVVDIQSPCVSMLR